MLRMFLWGVFVVVVLCGALFFYFIYSPRPKIPRLSGQVASGIWCVQEKPLVFDYRNTFLATS